MANTPTNLRNNEDDTSRIRRAMDESFNRAIEIQSKIGEKRDELFEELLTKVLLPIVEAMGYGQEFIDRLIDRKETQESDLRLFVSESSDGNVVKLEPSRENLYYDSLTDILNRRFFDEHMRRLINTLSRSEATLSLMMIDVDFLKIYNETYGHGAGDACLKAIAKVLSETISRADDFVVRYGGDEFIVALPNTEEDGARMLAEKMLDNIRNLDIDHEHSSAADVVTVSIGLATGKVKPMHRTDDFILQADELLYRSKQSGYNRCTSGRI